MAQAAWKDTLMVADRQLGKPLQLGKVSRNGAARMPVRDDVGDALSCKLNPVTSSESQPQAWPCASISVAPTVEWGSGLIEESAWPSLRYGGGHTERTYAAIIYDSTDQFPRAERDY